MWRSFLIKGTFWGMFFVGVGFGGNSREPSIPHDPKLVMQCILKQCYDFSAVMHFLHHLFGLGAFPEN